ncbi:MAG TPA: hypothetical protein P5235_05245 [Saprospiraceae bacterium]|nr:hypothetical protein [Saprospiraceae bacterium]HRX28767.1 hypothetical protein [Saprospiraceae bacterium]
MCRSNECNIEKLNGCWWAIDNDTYIEICFDNQYCDLFMEDVYLVSKITYSLDVNHCYLNIYRGDEVFAKYEVAEFSKKVIHLLNSQDEKIEMNKIEGLNYNTEQISGDPKYYDKFSLEFHNRLMANKYSAKY